MFNCFLAGKYTQCFNYNAFIFHSLGDAVSKVELTEAKENKGHP